jgi:hypothetical protein
VADDDGVVEKVIHTQGGSSFDAAKVDLPEAIEISTEKLDEYVGSYSFGFLAGNMVISRDGDQMYGKLASQPKLKIIPVAEDEFAWVDVAATMKFVRDQEGNIIRGDFTKAGNTTKAKRVKVKDRQSSEKMDEMFSREPSANDTKPTPRTLRAIGESRCKAFVSLLICPISIRQRIYLGLSGTRPR